MAVKTMKQIAARMKKAREKHGLSLREVARRSGVSVANLSKLEAGKTANPTLWTMAAVAEVYGLSLKDWF